MHLAFVLVVFVLAEIFAAWALLQYPRTGDQISLWTGLLAFIGGLGLCVHAVRYARKMDTAQLR